MRIYTIGSGRKIGQNSGGADPQAKEERHRFEPFNILLFICSFLGLHLLRKDADGSYVVCRWRLVPMAALGLMSLVCLTCVLVYQALVAPPLWFVIILLPLCLGYCFCILTFVLTYRNTRALAEYLHSVSELQIKLHRPSALQLINSILVPVMLVVVTYSLVPKCQPFLPSVFVTSCVPAIFDLYMMHFVKMLQTAYDALGRDIRARVSLSIREVQAMADRWLTLTEIVAAHNKIFNVILHWRLWLLVVQSMAHLFVLWALRQYYGACLPLLLITVLPLAELFLRFLYLCNNAEALTRADEEVVEAAQEATLRVPTGSRVHLALSAFSCHMVAQPAAIHVWGMDSLSSSTFVSLSGVVLTYLVVILQFSQKVNYDFTGSREGELDRFNECFAEGQGGKGFGIIFRELLAT